MTQNDLAIDAEAPAPAPRHTDADLGFLEALWLRARVSRPFYISIVVYGLFALIGLQTGLLPSDVLVTAGIFFILVMGLDLLFGMAGLLSFAHVAFFAIAAYSVVILNTKFGVNIWLAGLIGTALNIILSYILGRVCLRLSGSYFILGTLAFGLMVGSFINIAYPLTGGGAGIGGLERPEIFGAPMQSDLQIGAFIWFAAIAVLWYSLAMVNSRSGRAMRAMRSDPEAAQALGINTERLRNSTFVLSATYASLAGILYAMYFGALHPISFNIGVLVNVLLMLFIGGYGSFWGGLVGATFIILLPDLNASLNTGKDLFNGLLFAVIILAFPRGTAGIANTVFRHWNDRRGQKLHHPFDPVGKVSDIDVLTPYAQRGQRPDRLEIRDVKKHYGGVRAVDGVSTSVSGGQIKGLIGPNGAGKSTLINLISGSTAPTSGEVFLGEKRLTGLLPHQIARLGVVRTFQNERLFGDLNVIENVMVGFEQGSDGRFRDLLASAVMVRGWAKEELQARRAARAWLEFFGLGDYAEQSVEQLPTGLRKLVEVARACASGPVVLLLDETAAGLNETERQSFRQTINRLREAGMAIVLIEHDLEMVMALSDEICVLDFGQKIADDVRQVVLDDERVISAYLGG